MPEPIIPLTQDPVALSDLLAAVTEAVQQARSELFADLAVACSALDLSQAIIHRLREAQS